VLENAGENPFIRLDLKDRLVFDKMGCFDLLSRVGLGRYDLRRTAPRRQSIGSFCRSAIDRIVTMSPQ